MFAMHVQGGWYDSDLRLLTPASLSVSERSATYCDNKARKRLGYHHLYSLPEAIALASKEISDAATFDKET